MQGSLSAGRALMLLVPVMALLPACNMTKQPDIAGLDQQHITLLAQRLWDQHEVSNLMGRFVHLNGGGAELFALDEPEVAAEFPGEARYQGRDAVSKRLEVAGHGRPGALAAPVIEVAEDGLTAKAVWSQPAAAGDCAADFKRVNGQWKIWHLHVYPAAEQPKGPLPYATWADTFSY